MNNKDKKPLNISDFEYSLRIIDSMLIETGGSKRIMQQIIASSITKAKSMLLILSKIKEGLLTNKIINYQLKKVRDCEMTKACWFYLTDSYYYLQLGDERIYEYTTEAIKKDKLKSPFLDYSFSRFLEDIFVVLLETIQPIPKEIYQMIDTDKKHRKLCDDLFDWYYGKSKKQSEPAKEKEPTFKLLGENFLWQGSLDSSFISGSILCRFVHVEDIMYIHYDCTKHKNVWTASKNVFQIPYQEFILQIEDLIETFFADMDKQVLDAIVLLTEDEYLYNDFSEDYKKDFRSVLISRLKAAQNNCKKNNFKENNFSKRNLYK